MNNEEIDLDDRQEKPSQKLNSMIQHYDNDGSWHYPTNNDKCQSKNLMSEPGLRGTGNLVCRCHKADLPNRNTHKLHHREIHRPKRADVGKHRLNNTKDIVIDKFPRYIDGLGDRETSTILNDTACDKTTKRPSPNKLPVESRNKQCTNRFRLKHNKERPTSRPT